MLSDRELLIKVFKFMRYPPAAGSCVMVNYDALKELYQEIRDNIYPEDKC